MISYELPPYLFNYFIDWESYYLDYTWEQMDNTWNV
jgi:hypothetical protein